ncbi:hypothetical protein B0X78_05520, partial [bacterium AM6]
MGGKHLGSTEIPLTDNFNMDQVFDPELGGLGSHGLLGNAYGLLRHRERELEEHLQDQLGQDYQRAKGWRRATDPLVLDLDGDGIETTAADGKIVFDHEGNAVREGTGWISPDDGLLVLDRNGNGLIDDGSELFGDHTPGAALEDGQYSSRSAGLRALAIEDKNGDGRIDADDEVFASLRVWRDLNQDGVSQANELFSLSELGIRSIAVDPTSTQNVALGNGNTVDSYGSFERVDGTLGVTADLLLGNNSFYREFVEKIPLSELATQVVNVAGSGWVRDLQEAITLDANIYTLINKIDSGYSRSQAMAALDEVLLAWSGTSAMRSSVEFYQEGVNRIKIDAKGMLRDGTIIDISQKLSMLEKFNGELFFASADGQLGAGGQWWSPKYFNFDQRFDVVLGPDQTEFLLKSYDALKLHLYTGIVLDTRLSEYTSLFRLGFNDQMEVVLVMDDIIARLRETQRLHGTTAALEDLLDLRSLQGALPFFWNWKEVVVDLAGSTVDPEEFVRASNSLLGVLQGSNVTGGVADDMILGTDGDDTLSGESGDDSIYGGLGNDVIDGGLGANNLYGGVGNDTLSVHT